jgi:hypothetical protein
MTASAIGQPHSHFCSPLRSCLVRWVQKSQKRRRVIPVLMTDVPAIHPASASDSPVAVPAASAVGATSIASLAHPAQSQAEEAEEAGVENLAPPKQAAVAAEGVHMPAVKKAQRKIQPQAV